MVEYLSGGEIILGVLAVFWPVWLAVAAVMVLSFAARRRLGLYGQLYDTTVGMVGLFILFFWLFTALLAAEVAPFDPLEHASAFRYEGPGAFLPDAPDAVRYFGGDRFGRDVLSLTIYGSQIVLTIAPAATLFAFMVGITLGLPAGYYGGRIDAVLSFLANLVLAFPVILLFFLLVSPQIQADSFVPVVALVVGAALLVMIGLAARTAYLHASGRAGQRAGPVLGAPFIIAALLIAWIAVAWITGFEPISAAFGLERSALAYTSTMPEIMAGAFFLFPMIFFGMVFATRFGARPSTLAVQLLIVFAIGGWIYLALVFGYDPIANALGRSAPILSLEPNELNIFVAVVFVSSPGVFRIVRGLTFDVATRDYVAAARTRGERPGYTMIWEILPNARGPLIVDACLRIGYTTILLGTLGYFGLGLAPESADWGTQIKDSSRLLRLYVHPAIPPALALMSFVLGLNLLADALREQSLKD